MTLATDNYIRDYDPRFKIFHELMAKKIREVLLVSTPYDAWIMEEDVRLSERIINEYRGLNLSNPPRLTWVSSVEEALKALDNKKFDMVITMPSIVDTDCLSLGERVKQKDPDLPVMLFVHRTVTSLDFYPEHIKPAGIDRTFVWSGNTDILVALIKSAEDRLNVDYDTSSAGIRVLLFVEDSPQYLSSLLPIFYRELVSQTQAVMEEGLNEEHRLLNMRARPKILIADDYENAISLYEKYKPNILGVISDVRFPKEGKLCPDAGIELLTKIKADRWDIPLLLMSSEPSNHDKAALIPSYFVDKNSRTLHADVHDFFMEHLGFGDFVFRMPDGREVSRASNLRTLENEMNRIPIESLMFHANRNDFSRWLFARTETILASKLRPAKAEDFSYDAHKMRKFLVSNIHERRRRRQKGVIVNFDAHDFDPDTEFFKIGNGSVGGKARGLAFASDLLRHHSEMLQTFSNVDIMIPKSLVVTTDGFETFIHDNHLLEIADTDMPDEEIAKTFLQAKFPKWIRKDLEVYLKDIHYPIAVRSSSLLEDSQFRAYAGLYRTYMLPNDCPNFVQRTEHVINAIKLVYASTYFRGPKSFSKRVGHRTEEEKMAVIIQSMVGDTYGEHFYPALSGVAQSHNYYPFSHMKPEEGIATIALGLGKMVVEGEKTLRFSPKYPQLLPQRSTVEDILENSQRYFYALKLEKTCSMLSINDTSHLDKREMTDAENEYPVSFLSSTYISNEHRIRDTSHVPGHRVITFSQILKYKSFPLPDILEAFLAIGQKGMGCPVELEFSVNLSQNQDTQPTFALLQLRPMTARAELEVVNISDEEIEKAFCYSSNALGNAHKSDITDIVYVKPDVFDPAKTIEIAREIGEMNNFFSNANRKYLLIGPGRWGSADRWLGIPVDWTDICNVDVIAETTSDRMHAEPSQGSHFFHNITTMGINYISISEKNGGFFNGAWLTSLPSIKESEHVRYVALDKPITIKVDGRSSRCVMMR
jgi:DNA-binding NarL/FixJ family response regulator